MTSKTSITYGGALYDLAKDEGLSAQILADLGAFAAVFREDPDYRRLLTEPSIPKAEREALLDEAWKDALHPYTLNFVKLLCANGTVSQLPDCDRQLRKNRPVFVPRDEIKEVSPCSANKNVSPCCWRAAREAACML